LHLILYRHIIYLFYVFKFIIANFIKNATLPTVKKQVKLRGYFVKLYYVTIKLITTSHIANEYFILLNKNKGRSFRTYPCF